jgi:dihydrofolate reductase
MSGLVSFVVAVSANGVIGRNDTVPWRLSTDLKRLKSLTMGHHVIMGRKTFETLPAPLPGRTNVVVTREAGYRAPEGVLVAASVEEALELAAADEEIFILGGAQIYAQALHRANRMYLTEVHTDVKGDTYFPDFDEVVEWKLVDREDHEADEKNEFPFSFLLYERNGSGERPMGEDG